jgi:hypothetical protein
MCKVMAPQVALPGFQRLTTSSTVAAASFPALDFRDMQKISCLVIYPKVDVAGCSLFYTLTHAHPPSKKNPYGLHLPQGEYPSAISSSLVPVKVCLLLSLMSCTLLQEG